MALEDILKKIADKSRKDIELLEKEVNQKCKVIKEEVEKEIKDLEERNINTIKANALKLQEHMLQDARLKIAKSILNTKSDALEEVFKEALKKLENLPAKEYLIWIERTIPEVIEPGKNEIILPEGLLKKVDIEEFLKDMNKRLNGKSHIELLKKTDGITGGFILKVPKKDINCSFKSLLEEKRNSLKVKISRLLFDNAAN